jgi:hypothetical protein
VSDSTFSLCTAGLGLMLGLGTVPQVNAAADDGCPDPHCSLTKSQFNLDLGTFGYDPANASLLGRQLSLQVVKRWGQ